MTPESKGLALARIYDPRSAGYRVLVDRLWPRGVSKGEAALDEWLKDLAPGTDLRKWYGHDVERFAEFRRRYLDELKQPPAIHALDHVLDVARTRPVVLLTATRDVDHSAARVLFEHLRGDEDA